MADGKVVIEVVLENGQVVKGFADLKGQIGDVEKQSDKTSVSVGKMLTAFGLAKVASAAMNTLKNSVGKAVNRIDTIDTATKSLTTLTGSTKEATKIMDNLTKAIEGTPIALDQVALGAKKMVASGMEGEKVERVFKSIADAAYGVGAGADSIDPMITAFSQMQTSAKLSLGPIRSLEDQGVPALKILANQAGISADEMQKKISSGAVDSKKAIDDLAKGIQEGTDGINGSTAKMAGLAKTAGDTLSGSFANMKTAIVSTIAKGLEPFKNVAIDALQKVTAAIKAFRDNTVGSEKIQKALANLTKSFSSIGKVISPLIPLIKGFVAAFMTILGVTAAAQAVKMSITGIKVAISTLGAISPVTILVGAIVGLGVAFMTVYKKSESFRKAVDNLIEPLKNVAKGAKLVGTALVEMFKNGPSAKIADSRKQFLKLFPESLWNSAMKFIITMNDIKNAAGIAFNGLTEMITKGPSRAIADLRDQFGTMFPTSIFDKVVRFGGNINDIKLAISALKDIVGGSIKTLYDFDGVLGGAFSSKTTKALFDFGKLIRTTFDNATKTVKEFSNEIVKAFQSGDFSKVGELAGKIMSNLTVGLIGGLPALLAKIFSFAPDIVKKLGEGIQGASGNIAPYVQSFAQSFWSFFSNFASSFFSNSAEIVIKVAQGISSSISYLLPVAVEMATKLKDWLVQSIPSMMEFGSQLVSKISESINQAFPTIGPILTGAITSVFETIKNIVEPLANVLGTIFDTVKTFVSSIAQGFDTFGTSGGSAVASITMSLMGLNPVLKLAITAFRNFGPQIAGIFNQVGTAIEPLVATIGTAFGQLAATIIPMVVQAVSALLPVFMQVGSAILNIISTVLPVLISLFNQLVPVVMQIVTMVAELFTQLAPLVATLVNSIVPVITTIVTVVMNLITSLMPSIIAIIQVIMQVIQALIPIITAIVTVVVEVIASVISAIQPIIAFIGMVITTIMAIITPIVTFIAGVISSIISFITPIISVVSNVFSTVFSIVSGIWRNIMQFISTIINSISSIISSLTGVVGSVFNAISSTVNGVMNGVSRTITGVFNAIKSSWNGLTAFVSGVFNGVASAVQSLVGQVKGFVNGVIGGVNAAIGIINKIPGVSIGAIPYLAKGTKNFGGGAAVINEKGGELVVLPSGSQVIPHDLSLAYAKEAARYNAVLNLPRIATEKALNIDKRVGNTTVNNVTNYQIINENANNNDGDSRVIEIHVTSEFNARAAAKELVEPIRVELDRYDRFENRKRGKT